MIAGNHFKVRKMAKIRKRYNQVPRLIQGTTRGSNKNTQNEEDGLLKIDQLAVAFIFYDKGKFHQSFVFVCPLCTLVKFACFCYRHLSEIPSECQIVWNQIRPDILLPVHVT